MCCSPLYDRRDLVDAVFANLRCGLALYKRRRCFSPFQLGRSSPRAPTSVSVWDFLQYTLPSYTLSFVPDMDRDGSSPDKLLVFTSSNIYDSTLVDTATGDVTFCIRPVQYSTWVYTDQGVRREQVRMNATVIQNEKGLDLALVGWNEAGEPHCVVLGSSKGERDIATRHHLRLGELFQSEDVDWAHMCTPSSIRCVF